MKVRISIEGTKPLLMHSDDIVWAEKVKRWQKTPENKKISVAGDDRSPSWTWIGSMYHDGERVVIPSDNIMVMLREGGAQVPTGKRQGTFKSQTQSGIIPLSPGWTLRVADGRPVDVAELLALEEVEDFEEHIKVVKEHGFDLLVKRARIGQSKHIRVRPVFRAWSASGEVEVIDNQITLEVLQMILDLAGRLKGLGDWRPSSKTPGGYGTFTAICEC